MKCSVCKKGKIIASTLYQAEYRGGTSIYLDQIYCEKCSIVFNHSILPTYFLTPKYPYWKEKINECCKICGKYDKDDGRCGKTGKNANIDGFCSQWEPRPWW